MQRAFLHAEELRPRQNWLRVGAGSLSSLRTGMLLRCFKKRSYPIRRITVMNLREQTYLWYIVILRLYIGYYLLQQGILKYLRGFPQSDWINRQIGDLDKVEIYAWYKSFLINIVVPHRELFGYLVMSGEILVGLCLVFGLLTSLRSSVGIVMLLD